jgi:hypothetical protein
MDLTDRMMWVAPGPPCCGEYVPHWLEAPAEYPAPMAVENLFAAGSAI